MEKKKEKKKKKDEAFACRGRVKIQTARTADLHAGPSDYNERCINIGVVWMYDTG